MKWSASYFVSADGPVTVHSDIARITSDLIVNALLAASKEATPTKAPQGWITITVEWERA